ncbi:hypothetical protein COY62_00935 [bacterium (Candidatus Howlettbacteria) CG_4_10_14_0_8_um_filter_40_9]|nr:MAG: hypothetical protein COY62_00935 [bacterium (Candidatus Howlettbacteria) CG_4_10_14_0_8_um_filter_40_9]
MKYKEIQVVKIGSQALFRDEIKLDFNRIDDLCLSLKFLRDEKKIMTVLITSGAVSLGKQLADLNHVSDPILRDQIYASIGQPELMRLYSLNLGENVCQLLPTHSILNNGSHHSKIKKIVDGLIEADIFPIINYNDPVDDNEMMQVSTYTDNDKVAEEISLILGARRLIILTTVDGVIDCDGALVTKIDGKYETAKGIFKELEIFCDGKNERGTGGMISKVKTAEKLYREGIETIIGNASYQINHLLEGRNEKGETVPRTIFKPNN